MLLWARKAAQRVGKEGGIRMWVFSASELIADGSKLTTEFVLIGGGALRAWRLRKG